MAASPAAVAARVVIDGAAWAVAAAAAAVSLRGPVAGPAGSASWSASRLMVLAAVAAAVHWAVGWSAALYTKTLAIASFEEACLLAAVGLVAASAAGVADVTHVRAAPVATWGGASLVALLLMAAGRAGLRARQGRRHRHDPRLARMIVLGAGETGVQIVSLLMRHVAGPYLPVALLDEAADRRATVCGVRIRGGWADLERVAARVRAEVVLIAVPDADAALVRDVTLRAEAIGLRVRLLPPLSDLFDRALTGQDLRPVTPADLLGRHEAGLELDAVADYVRDRAILVTGAGGSIGSELCRQLQELRPRRLVMLDRDESALHGVQLSLEGRALLDARTLVVADIRDLARLREVFAEHSPEVVFHAAALKHLPLLEMHPSEAAKTNVMGTANLLRVATEWQVDRFVNISTDKAAAPVSVLGYSKRIAERLTAWADGRGIGTAISVRFGNVLGSRGSVLTIFAEQIRRGGPVTVTHPDVTRYFMTVQEAVRLVVQAGAIGGAGEVLVLDMGEPVPIADVARRLIKDAGGHVELVFTGLRAGEKLHESLFGDGETRVRKVHPLISHVPVPPLEPAIALALLAGPDVIDDRVVAEDLRALASARESQVVDLRDPVPGSAPRTAGVDPVVPDVVGPGRSAQVEP